MLLLAMACTPTTSSPLDSLADSDPVVESDPDWDTNDVTQDELTGRIPENPLPVPEFSAVFNYDGSARTQVDLVGHPTVVWFYPLAGTYG
jgi:hypothetical protein